MQGYLRGSSERLFYADMRGGSTSLQSAVDDMTVRAAGVLAEKGHWTWMFHAATEELTSWQDLHGDHWVVDPINGYIYVWEWGT